MVRSASVRRTNASAGRGAKKVGSFVTIAKFTARASIPIYVGKLLRFLPATQARSLGMGIVFSWLIPCCVPFISGRTGAKTSAPCWGRRGMSFLSRFKLYAGQLVLLRHFYPARIAVLRRPGPTDQKMIPTNDGFPCVERRKNDF